MKVIKIGADWCPECLIMKPRWAEIERELAWLETEFVDLDKNPEVKKERKIDHVPTFIFLDNQGNEFERMQGIIEKNDLIDFLNQNKDR